MNDFEEYLYKNPQLIEKFMRDKKPLLNEIKQTYADMLESGDLTGRFLLSKALMEIVKITTEAGQELLKAEMSQQGINVTTDRGVC